MNYKYAPYSYSKIHLFLSCPYAWKLAYIDHVKAERHPSLELGARVHEIVEQYLRALQQRGEQSNHSLLEEILQRHGDLSELEDFVAGIKSITLPPKTKVGIELKLGLTDQFEPCDYESDSAFIRGKIDLTYRVGNTAVVIDWKTNQHLPDEAVIDSDMQTRFYAFLLSAYVPEEIEEFLIELNYLRHAKVRKVSIAPEDLQLIKTWVLENIEKIEIEQNFEPTPGDWCRICGYVKQCPVAKAVLPVSQSGLTLPEKITSIDQALRLAGALKVLDQVRDKIQRLLKDWVQENGAIKLQGEVLDFHRSETVRWLTPKQKGDLVKVLLNAGVSKEEIWEIFSTNKTAVCSFLRSRKLKSLLEEALSTGQKEQTERFYFKKV